MSRTTTAMTEVDPQGSFFMKGARMSKQRIPSDAEVSKFMGIWPDTEWDRAWDDLRRYVHPVPWRMDAFVTALHEYYLFEHILGNGMTIAQTMACLDDSLRNWSESEFVRVVADRPFEGDVAFMRDIHTGATYEVHGFITEHPNWEKGSLGCRLCKIGGTYSVVGAASFHDNAELVDMYVDRPTTFMDDLKCVIGDGGFADTITAVNFR